MQILKTAHLICICIWFGLVCAETIIEIKGSKKNEIAQTAKLHFWIDLLFEIPIVLSVLITGILLLLFSPFSSLLMLKIIFGLMAISISIYCAVLVILRYRKSDDLNFLYYWSRKIRWTWLGVPFGLGAVYLGLAYFHS